ncbi:cyclic lactone autoinducer peptide [[Clostridium] spiroforme]|nr:cyclic lactone autoinducer peptide [Thomasclavelia spiroformis]
MKKYSYMLFGLCTLFATTLRLPPSWWFFYEPKKPEKFMK